MTTHNHQKKCGCSYLSGKGNHRCKNSELSDSKQPMEHWIIQHRVDRSGKDVQLISFFQSYIRRKSKLMEQKSTLNN